jgi:LysR family malonate utilization transcriptional regulator
MKDRIRIGEEISFRKLEIFLAYMKAGNFTAASGQLGISPVSVHRAIHSLQEGLRCNLFIHKGRDLVPTEAAFVLAQVAGEVLDRMESGIEAAREAAGYASNKMRIGSLYSLTSDMVPEIIKSLASRKPNFQCELVLGRSKFELLPKLRDGGLDAVFSEVTPDAPGLISIPIFDDQVYFAAPHNSRYSNLKEIDLRDCSGERVVTLKDGLFTVANLTKKFPQFRPTYAMEVIDIFALMNLIASGVACALVPGRVCKMYQHLVDFIPLLEDQQVFQTIGVSFLASRERDPNLLALCAVVRGYIRRTQLPI